MADWTLPQLQKALGSAITSLSDTARFCLFVDGLDEFKGDGNAHDELVTMIKRVLEFEHVKICVSSRPWVIYQFAFEATPRLELHHLTSPDIDRYVEEKLLNSPEYTALKTKKLCTDSSFAAEITRKAQGVFVWVILVVRDLIQGLRNRDSLEDLWRKPKSIPTDLYEYFNSMFDRLDKYYLDQACFLLRVAIIPEEPYSLVTYSFILDGDDQDTLTMESRPGFQKKLQGRCDDCEWKLNSRCRGLLEVAASFKERDCWTRKVGFIHKTVKDFLLAGGLQNIESQVSKELNGVSPSDVNEAIAKSFLAQIKLLDSMIMGDVAKPIEINSPPARS